MSLRLVLSLALVLVGGAVLSQPASAVEVNDALMKTLDPDNDGTVDLEEAKAAGAKMFQKLNPDDDGTLDMNELKGRISEDEFKAADPDDDGTLDEDEYMALIEKLFKEANPDGDGTLDKKELESPAGQKLLNLIS